jgi:hypothetical protein
VRYQPCHGSDRIPARRLTDEHRARFAATGSEQEYDTVLAQTRLAHIGRALAEAVAAGRLAPPDEKRILARLAAGEDPHAVRRELRAAGVLIRQEPHGDDRHGGTND